MGNGVEAFRKTGIAFAVAALALFVVTPSASADGEGPIRPTTDANELAGAITSDPSLVTGASFVTLPPGTPDPSFAEPISPVAVSTSAMTGFATDGPDYAILTTGNPLLANHKNNAPNSGRNAGGDHFQGTQNHDVTVMQVDVDVPATSDCLTLNYRFLSEEFSEFIGKGFNDTFILQLDRYDWQSGSDSVVAPADFATTGASIGVDSTGDYAVTPERAHGTTYDGATSLITAKTRVTPGAHSIYLTIFDQGDAIYDTAVFVDNLRTSHEAPGNCEPPAVTDPTIADPTSGKGLRGPDSDINRFQSRVKAKDLKSFSGTASADNLARVEIALVALKGGAQAARRRAPRCVALNSKRLMTQRRSVGKRCASLIWVPAEGTGSWHFDLKRKLPKGNYALYSRAIDMQGNVEAGWSAQDGNKTSFTVL